MATLEINLEQHDQLYYAHSTNLLGCYGKEKTKSETIEAILQDAKKYSKWLISFTEEISQKIIIKELLSNINDVKIIQEIQQQDEEILFDTDKDELSLEMFEFYLSIYEKLPQELLRIIFHYSSDELNQVIIPEEPTIHDHLTNQFKEELNLICSIDETIEQKFFEIIDMNLDELETLTLMEKIVKIQQTIITVLKQLFPEYKNKIIESTTQESHLRKWTFKKIIRLLIENERDKLNDIRILVDILEENKASLANGLN